MMNAWINAILSLQALDLKLRGFRTRLETVPLEKKRLVTELHAAEDKAKKVKMRQLELEKALKETEAQEAAVNDTVKKLLSQSSLVRKNNEYQAMMADIDAKKAQISDLESKQLELMDRIEAAKADTVKAEHECAVTAKQLRAEAKELVGFETDLKKSIHDTESLRDAHKKNLNQGHLDVYQRLIDSGKGDPLVRILDSGSCANCGMKLTQQTILTAKHGDFVLCDSCSHIVYFPSGE